MIATPGRDAAEARPHPLRIAAIADADSSLRWAAALIAAVPDVSRHLALVQTPLTVDEDQQRTALADTGLDPVDVLRIGFDQVRAWLDDVRADVLVLSARGPLVRLLPREVDHAANRPVVVVGMPGMSIPAERETALDRRWADLFVVHSRREKRAFAELFDRIGFPMELALATLPVAHRTLARPIDLARDLAVDAARTQPLPRHVEPRGGWSRPGGTDLVFAAQALIPRERAERMQLAGVLRAAALADPSRRVVVKLRATRPAGEEETHLERDPYEELLANRPENLVFSQAPMRDALEHAEGLVTVSSTAAIEAIALGVPVIAIDTFGVRKTNLNTVFAGSGVLGSAEDVVARRFRHASPAWREQNYFHREIDSTWWTQAQRLVARRRRGELAARRVPVPRGGALRQAWERKTVLGDCDDTRMGALALALGTPAIRMVQAVGALRRRDPKDAATDDASDITMTPARRPETSRRTARAI